MPFLREVPALLRSGVVYAALVVSGQETAGAAGLFDQAQLGAVGGKGGVALNEFILTQGQCCRNC